MCKLSGEYHPVFDQEVHRIVVELEPIIPRLFDKCLYSEAGTMKSFLLLAHLFLKASRSLLDESPGPGTFTGIPRAILA